MSPDLNQPAHVYLDVVQDRDFRTFGRASRSSWWNVGKADYHGAATTLRSVLVDERPGTGQIRVDDGRAV